MVLRSTLCKSKDEALRILDELSGEEPSDFQDSSDDSGEDFHQELSDSEAIISWDEGESRDESGLSKSVDQEQETSADDDVSDSGDYGRSAVSFQAEENEDNSSSDEEDAAQDQKKPRLVAAAARILCQRQIRMPFSRKRKSGKKQMYQR